MAEDTILAQPGGDSRSKRDVRAAMRQRRQALSAGERMQAAEAISHHLLASLLFDLTGYVAGYWAMGGELPLHVLQMRLREGQVWCLPCVRPDNSLRFAPWRPGDPLVGNRYGIPEPELDPASQLTAADMAVILLPLVAFTAGGARLGMGGGYYDRSLPLRLTQPAPPVLIGVGYGFQQVDRLPREAWDVPLDAVVTEAGLIACGPAGETMPA